MLATYVRMAYHMQVNQLCRQHKHVFYCFCQWYHSISFHSISFPVYFISQRRVTHEQTKKQAKGRTKGKSKAPGKGHPISPDHDNVLQKIWSSICEQYENGRGRAVDDIHCRSIVKLT